MPIKSEQGVFSADGVSTRPVMKDLKVAVFAGEEAIPGIGGQWNVWIAGLELKMKNQAQTHGVV